MNYKVTGTMSKIVVTTEPFEVVVEANGLSDLEEVVEATLVEDGLADDCDFTVRTIALLDEEVSESNCDNDPDEEQSCSTISPEVDFARAHVETRDGYSPVRVVHTPAR